MNLFMLGVEDKFNDNRIIRLGKMIGWSRFRKMLTGIHKNDVDPRGGQKSYDHLMMLRVLILKEWHSLSDKETEDSLKVRLDFLVFSGFDLGEGTPDETTICRFRNAQGAVVDATIIRIICKTEKGHQHRERQGGNTNTLRVPGIQGQRCQVVKERKQVLLWLQRFSSNRH
jgi:hypothetical protein